MFIKIRYFSNSQEFILILKARSPVLCTVPPHPDLVKKLYQEYKRLKRKNKLLTPLQFLTGKGLVRERVPGLDDKLNIDPERPLNIEANLIQLPRFKPRGDTITLFLLVDFEDKPHSQSPENYSGNVQEITAFHLIRVTEEEKA